MCLAAAAPTAALADEQAVVWSATYKLDALGLAQKGVPTKVSNLDSLDVSVDIDLARLGGMRDASIHIEGLNTSGQTPGARASVLQGVDDIEAGHRHARLYQAWFEKGLDAQGSSLRLGFLDPTGEFATADSAAWLVAPAFGAPAEYAASGPNGAPSFPSSSLQARLKLQLSKDIYAKAAIADAHAGAFGDPGGADFSFRDGVLGLWEVGWTGVGKVAVGGWAFSKHEPALGRPDGNRAQYGAYFVVDQPLGRLSPALAPVSAFVRAGLADGDTTPIGAAAIFGVTVKPATPARPDSVVSLGFSHGALTSGFRAAPLLSWQRAGRKEDLIELSYSDKVTSFARLQPMLQFAPTPSGSAPHRSLVVLGIRLSIAWDNLRRKSG